MHLDGGVKVNEFIVPVDSDNVARLEVGVHQFVLGVQVIQGLADIVCKKQDFAQVVSGDTLGVDDVLQTALGRRHHETQLTVLPPTGHVRRLVHFVPPQHTDDVVIVQYLK